MDGRHKRNLNKGKPPMEVVENQETKPDRYQSNHVQLQWNYKYKFTEHAPKDAGPESLLASAEIYKKTLDCDLKRPQSRHAWHAIHHF